MMQQLPPGATPIDADDFYRTIGELYFQIRVYQRVIAQLQAQQAARNGTADDAVHLER